MVIALLGPICHQFKDIRNQNMHGSYVCIICYRLTDIRSRNVHDLDLGQPFEWLRSNVNVVIERPHATYK